MTVLGIALTNHSHSRSEPCRLFPRWRQQELCAVCASMWA